MKRLVTFVLLLALVTAPVCGLAAPASSAPEKTTAVESSSPASAPAVAAAGDRSPGAAIATTVATITGIAISPLLGTGAYGAWRWWQAKTPEARSRLPWFAQVTFWLPALLLAAAVAAKDAFGAAAPPGLKKPLDVLETLENKMSGLVAAGAVIPFTIDALGTILFPEAAQSLGGPGVMAGVGGAGGLLPLAAIDWAPVMKVLTVPLAVAVFGVVWLASHAINVLILLSPWGAIDAALKSARASLLGLIVLTAALDPRIAALLSLAVILVSALIAGWAFRLMVFGTVFAWEVLTLGRRRFRPREDANKLFSGNQLTGHGVPLRSLGRLARAADGRLEFTYRPWLVLPARTVELATGPDTHVGAGLFFSTVRDGNCTLLLLPPRYRGHEEAVVRIYGFAGGVKEAGLLRAWGSIRELFGGSATRAQVA